MREDSLEMGTAAGKSQLYCQKGKKHKRKTEFFPWWETRLELKCIQRGCQWCQGLRNEKIAGSQNRRAQKKGMSEWLRTSCDWTEAMAQKIFKHLPCPGTMEFPQGRNKSCYFRHQILQGSSSLSERGWDGEDKSLMHQVRQQRTGWGDLQYLW